MIRNSPRLLYQGTPEEGGGWGEQKVVINNNRDKNINRRVNNVNSSFQKFKEEISID